MLIQNDPVPAVSELIGREGELGRLAELAAAAEAGRGALVLLAGEAGAGKTALARTALAATGFRTLEAAAPETPGPPYRPITAVLRAHRREWGPLLQHQPELHDYLACVLPELAPAPRPNQPDAVCESVATACAPSNCSRTHADRLRGRPPGRHARHRAPCARPRPPR